MENKTFAFLVLSLFLISVSFYLFNQSDAKLLNVVSARTTSLFTCGYNDMTNIFRAHGMPSQSIIRDIHKIGPGHLSILLTNLIVNRTEIYIYNLGNDLKLNTSDDSSYNLNSFVGGQATTDMRPLMLLDNGTFSSYSLYWVEHTAYSKNIKSCQMTSNGCITINTIASVPSAYFRGFNFSPNQNRLYVVYNTKTLIYGGHQYNYSIFRSCSVNAGSSDYCTGNFSNFTLYPYVNQYNITYTYYTNVPEIGFIVRPNYPLNYSGPIINDPDFTYLFNMNSNNSTSIFSLPAVEPYSVAPVGIDHIFAIRKDVNFLNDTISLINIPTNTYVDMDTLPESVNSAFFLEYDLNSIVTLYKDNDLLTWGRRNFGMPSRLIYNNTIGPEITPKFLLNDSSVIGFINNQFRVVRFTCSP